ncbi:complement component C8 gamma chain [Mixophyes fleayi]|uniref:complement component C8 gamma chain n=1 Tax=Mixophyes fleayi TaxID=3061075 RepID=UPI003F4D7F03
MLPPQIILFLLVLCNPRVWGQRKKPIVNPIDAIQSAANFDQNQFSGKWYLLSVSSECDYLKTNNHRVQATIIQVTQSKTSRGVETLDVSTFRKLDGICWEIKHAYLPNKAKKGRYALKAKGYSSNLDVVVAETDHQNYAILYYQRRNKITLKLYGRKTSVSDDINRKFDDHVSKQGIDLEYIYAFPTYGFCETADEFHILNEVPR